MRKKWIVWLLHDSPVVKRFIARLIHMDFQKIETSRFVFHMTLKKNRKSIAEHGLIASACNEMEYSNAVFAHNSEIPSIYWYPFVSSRYEYVAMHENPEYYFDFDSVGSYRDFKYLSDLYDIWEIDTVKLGKEWYLAKAALRDFGGDIFGGNELYVFTLGNISADCIRLVELKPEWKKINLEGVSVYSMFFNLI
jgi:hypothetical protein